MVKQRKMYIHQLKIGFLGRYLRFTMLILQWEIVCACAIHHLENRMAASKSKGSPAMVKPLGPKRTCLALGKKHVSTAEAGASFTSWRGMQTKLRARSTRTCEAWCEANPRAIQDPT